MANICVLPSFEHLRKVCQPYIILKETDAKLKRWSKFGLLRSRCFLRCFSFEAWIESGLDFFGDPARSRTGGGVGQNALPPSNQKRGFQFHV
jgi:hypothetical protein